MARPRTAPEGQPEPEPSSSSSSTSSSGFRPPQHVRLHPPDQEPSFTFVCLGVGGGPLESDCSCYLLKPADRDWRNGAVVVEGGSWLGALARILENVGPESAFADVQFPHDDAALRAGYLGSFAHSFLISHAHLDHIAGMVLGSASLPGKRKVLGLKPTLENLSDLFNGKIWPKLASWDDDGGPAVYHLKALYSQEQANIDDSLAVLPFALSHGLNPSVPPAPPTPSQTYPPGKPTSFFSKRYSLPLNGYFPALSLQPAKSPSSSPRDRSPSASGERPVFTSPFAPERAYVERLNEAQEGNEERDGSDYDTATQGSTSHDEAESPTPLPPPSSLLPRKEPALSPTSEVPPSADATTSSSSSLAPSTPPSSSTPSSSSKLQITTPDVGVSRAEELRERPRAARSISGRSRRPRTAQGSETGLGGRGATTAARAAASGTKAPPRRVSIDDESPPALDSTAFFITNRRTGRDVLFFGDVEPDCISRSPRNRRVWAHAAPRFVEKNLNTIFLECSFPASHPTQFLYGHLSVNHLFDEIRTLSRIVVAEKKRRLTRRQPAPPPPPSYPRSKLSVSQLPPIPASPMAASSVQDSELHGSLEGLSIVIVHVKTALFPSFEASPPSSSSPSSGEEVEQRPRVVDPRTMQQRILEELRDMEHDVGLGVRFEMAKQGMRIDC